MVTPDDVRDELSFDSNALGMDEPEFESLITRFIDRETERVEDAIDVVLSEETTVEQLSRPSSVDGPFLPLPNRPVQSVESIKIAKHVGGATVSVDDVFVEDTHLELKPDAERNQWPTDRRSIEIEWTHGYDAETLPGPVRAAIIGLVRAALQEIEADGIESESIGDQSVSYELRDDVVARHLRRAKRFDEPSYYGGAMMI